MKYSLKKLGLIVALTVVASASLANSTSLIAISPRLMMTHQLTFITHTGPGLFDNALAMNMPYQPIARVRQQLSKILNQQLSAFKGWNPKGEAHVTVITPPEYANTISPYVSMEKINEIAVEYRIQDSDMKVLGVGSGQVLVDQLIQSTFFLIVYSKNLLIIRQQIYSEYLKNGGPAESWNPMHFYPHITIGFTLRDLHEQDGVIKDAEHSLDRRFQLFWESTTGE